MKCLLILNQCLSMEYNFVKPFMAFKHFARIGTIYKKWLDETFHFKIYCIALFSEKKKKRSHSMEHHLNLLSTKFTVCVLVSQLRLTLCNPIHCSLASLSMGFSRQGHWSGMPFPSLGDLLTHGSNPGLLHCRQILYCPTYQGNICKM